MNQGIKGISFDRARAVHRKSLPETLGKLGVDASTTQTAVVVRCTGRAGRCTPGGAKYLSDVNSGRNSLLSIVVRGMSANGI